MLFQTINFLGLPITAGIEVQDICTLIGEEGYGRYITFINPYAWHIAGKDREYLSALSQMNYVLPDGIGVAVACKKITGFACHRISFDMTSLAGSFFTNAASRYKTVMLVGGAPEVAEKAAKKLQQAYPELRIMAPMSGYETQEAQVCHVMEHKPDIVIAGMGVPRQELLLAQLKKSQYAGLAITCGGFFDQYLQAAEYYPPLIDKLNLRFAYRLYKEPKRLWRRYFIEYQDFIRAFLWAFVVSKKQEDIPE